MEQTLIIDEPQAIHRACEAMRAGEATHLFDHDDTNRTVIGKVVKIERRDDGNFNITLRA